MTSYTSALFVVPTRILNLPGLVLSYLRVYETIFQFWNHEKTCYLSNRSIRERTSIESDSTIREAISFFEKHNEMKRETIKGRRYLKQPERKLEIIDQDDIVDNLVDPAAKSTPPRRQVDAPPAAKSTVTNIKKYNNKKLNKETVKIPNWLDKNLWDEFKEHRDQINKPMTQLSQKKMINKLDKIRSNGYNVDEIINKSIRLGWQDVFSPDENKLKKGNESSNEIRCTVKDWAPGNTDYDRVHGIKH